MIMMISRLDFTVYERKIRAIVMLYKHVYVLYEELHNHSDHVIICAWCTYHK